MAETIRQFGRIESPPDPRDYSIYWFMPRKIAVPTDTRVWPFNAVSLDQLETPHCVGFGGASFGINLPTETMYTNEDGHKFYYMCKEIDGEPKQENGSTVRSIAKVLKNIGAIEAYAFARDATSIKWWLRNRGPLIVGIMWTDAMMEPDENNILSTDGWFLGGHCLLLNGIIEEENLFVLQNSWGPHWGENGKAYIHVDKFMELFLYGGEALAAVELEDYSKKPKCPLADLWNTIKKLFE